MAGAACLFKRGIRMIQILANVTPGSGFFIKTLAKLSGESVHAPDGYNTWIQTLMQPGQELLQARAIFLVLDGHELLGRNIELDGWRDRLEMALESIRQFKQNHPDATLFVSTIDLRQRTLSAMVEKRLEHKIMTYWRDELEKAGIPVLELAELAANMGRDNFYSPRMWYLGSIPFSMAGEKALARECSRAFKALSGKRKKCLILDLDNTLWGGVIGEDGLDGITLAANGKGSCYRDFQSRIRELKNQGVLLAIVSKNNEEDALLPLGKHPEMVLTEKDFVAIKANWLPKAENIARLAKELNIGLDSFVFIDDNPVEREAVKLALPDVAVPDFPDNPFALESFISEIANEYFPLVRTTAEDLKKAEQYQTEKLRENEKTKFASLDDYLASLDMRLKIREVDAEATPRVAQLTQKTNQFNLTTRRYTEADIAQMVASTEWRLWIGELEDRFGSYGKIILCIAKIHGDNAVIDTFLMSCRVMGRNVESAFLDYVEKSLCDAGISNIAAEYVPSPKNSMTARFWNEQGYAMTEDKPEARTYGKSCLADSSRDPVSFITIVQD